MLTFFPISSKIPGMRLRRFCVTFLLVLSSTSLFFSEERPWTEVRSPHFRLITDGIARDGQRVLFRFELMRAVFENRYPRFRLDAPAQFLVIAARDESTAKQLLPHFWAHPGPKPGGVFEHGWEREYALVRLDAMNFDQDTYATIYHEYVHSLLHINFRGIPSWLDEGLAEFYGFTRFNDKNMYLGAPPAMDKVRFMFSEKPIPLEEFIDSNMFSSSNERTQLSYLQAWGLTHFLTFALSMEKGERLAHFIEELQNGIERKKAFQETIGKFEDVQKEYEQYIHKTPYPALAFSVPEKLDDKTFATRSMSPAETQAELAAWHIRFHQWEQVTELTEAAIKNDPRLPLGHEDKGFLLFNIGKDDEALKEFSTAFDLDNKNYIALFAKTMTSPASRSNQPQDQQATYDALNQVLALKPDFAPAFVELAKLAVARGQMETALALSRTAVKFEPFRSGYHVLTGEIMLRLNRPADAAAEAAYVAQRWRGSDRDEALELWNRIPPAERKVDVPMVPEAEHKWQITEGKLQSVSCNGIAFALTLDVNGKAQNYKAQGFPVGFSDTLWVGRDHFSPCFHVQGLRVIVHYMPAKDPSYVGDLVSAGFRDELGLPPQNAAAQIGVQ
jgi:tetratricopeptide (TPR) repeat protein